MGKTITFHNEITYYWEPPELSDLLHQARKNNYFQRQADKARMENLLTPILDPIHRIKIFKKLFSNQHQNKRGHSNAAFVLNDEWTKNTSKNNNFLSTNFILDPRLSLDIELLANYFI